MKDREWVYVAGPYSHGDQVINTRKVLKIAEELWDLGYMPIVPHLYMLWHITNPQPYGRWLDMGLHLLSRCDRLLRVPGPSPGADKEIEWAREHGLKIHYGLEDLINENAND